MADGAALLQPIFKPVCLLKLLNYIGLKKNDKTQVRVYYYTTNEARAMNWLTKEQTATKVLQYLFTQCEPIECRSVAPF